MSEIRHALVTGGSRGIGKAIVDTLLQQGYHVWSFARTQIEEQEHLRQVYCDIAERSSIEAALQTVISDAKTIDLLVNNAGITKDGLLMRMSDEAWDDVLAVNLTSVFLTCRKIGRLMTSQRRGSIVNISSVVGIMGNGGQTNYAASKAGIIGFSKSLAKELASRSVRVNVVAPGFIDTSMTDALPQQLRNEISSKIPLGRIGYAAEVAKAVAFLAGDEASYITGQVLAVDGGLAM